MVSPFLCPKCESPMAIRKGPFGQFLGCTRYPHCYGRRKIDGTAKPHGSSPADRKQESRQAAREAHNRAVVARMEAISGPDHQPCPFDGLPGENDTRTAFGPIGSLVTTPVTYIEPLQGIDAEYHDFIASL